MVLATNLSRNNVEELLAMLRVHGTRLSESDVFLIPGSSSEISGTYISLHYTTRRSKYILETNIYLEPTQYLDATINPPIIPGNDSDGVMLGSSVSGSASGAKFELSGLLRQIGYGINRLSMLIIYLFRIHLARSNEISVRRIAYWREDDIRQLKLAQPTTVV
jgi:hypothetical protein